MYDARLQSPLVSRYLVYILGFLLSWDEFDSFEVLFKNVNDAIANLKESFFSRTHRYRDIFSRVSTKNNSENINSRWLRLDRLQPYYLSNAINMVD